MNSMQVHSIDIMSGFSKGLYGSPIENDIIEFRAYKVASEWTGYIESKGLDHLSKIVDFYFSLYKK
ncbi:hypothetical protein [Chryseobacterium sp. c4a]|uniref:hypothetical protein n=1 Tax=Chryseobacterium sp. c4a TaxID=1573582 RepID=UPI0013589EE8|nr:hypothetical protein [Chryseobacterium sp. c4a]